MCRICTSNVRCGSGEIVSGATGGEFVTMPGFLPPTSGTATIYGQDIRKDMSRIVSTLGLCPRFNTLYGNLTVEEHIIFFAKVSFFSDWE